MDTSTKYKRVKWAGMRKSPWRCQRKCSSERMIELHHLKKNPFLRHTKDAVPCPHKRYSCCMEEHESWVGLNPGCAAGQCIPAWAEERSSCLPSSAQGVLSGDVKAAASQNSGFSRWDEHVGQGRSCVYHLRDIFTVGLSALPAAAPSLLLEAGTLCSRCQQVSSFVLYFCLMCTLVHEGLCWDYHIWPWDPTRGGKSSLRRAVCREVLKFRNISALWIWVCGNEFFWHLFLMSCDVWVKKPAS